MNIAASIVFVVIMLGVLASVHELAHPTRAIFSPGFILRSRFLRYHSLSVPRS